MQLLIVLALTIALVAVFFALQNTAIVSIQFAIWQFNSHLAFVLLVTLALGVLVGLLVSVPALLKSSWQISRHKRQLQDLDWQFQEKDKTISTHRQATEGVRQNYEELLTALTLTDDQTGLLRSETVVPTVSYALHQMSHERQNPQYSSVCIYLLEAQWTDGEAASADGTDDQVLRAIATQLQTLVSPNTWLHYGGNGRFICTTTGMEIKLASDYGESLRIAFAAQPLFLQNGSKIPITFSIGGAIAQASDFVDSHHLIQQAEAALDHAKRRGRNRFRLVQASS
jgi:GGDEF domain-containing protein/uncharacterized integral membrane protein